MLPCTVLKNPSENTFQIIRITPYTFVRRYIQRRKQPAFVVFQGELQRPACEWLVEACLTGLKIRQATRERLIIMLTGCQHLHTRLRTPAFQLYKATPSYTLISGHIAKA